KDIVPMQCIGDPSHRRWIDCGERVEFSVKPRGGENAILAGEHKADKNNGADQKRAAAKSHDDSRNEQRPEAMCTAKTSERPHRVQRDAIKKVTARAENARHPIADSQGAQESEVIKNDDPTDLVRTARDIALQVRQ